MYSKINTIKSKIILVILGSIFLLIAYLVNGTPILCAQESPIVKVKVSQENIGDGKIRYCYRVINSSDYAIVAVRIGFDYYHSVPELVKVPLNWDYLSGIPAGSVSSPNGWQARVVTQEENPCIFLEWSSEGGPSWDILPMQTMGGFSATLSNADATYKSAHFDVILGNSTHISGLLELEEGDTNPPSLSVTLSPSILWPPNHKMVLITPTITVTDNIDPSPVVEMTSINTNEGDETNTYDPEFDNTQGDGNTVNDIQVNENGNIYLRAERSGTGSGRIYTITYTATDASGNSSTASATVTVPHDQE